MARITEQAKQSAMERVWLVIKRYHPRGRSEAEIVEDTKIERKTVNNYVNAMKDEGKIIKVGKYWILTDFEETRLLSVQLSPEEAYTLYLGSRLLVKQHDKRNELAEKALLQLADKLVSDAKIGREIAQAARELAQRPMDMDYQSSFQTMVKAYIQRKQVKIRYKPLNGKAFETVFCTYLIEPSAIGYSTYIIGDSSLPNALRAYKLERIEWAEPQAEKYQIPDTFPGLDILCNSWSIIMGEETVKVVLRFSPEVKERLLETQWHPSQECEDDKEKPGWLRWWVYVAGTMDMIPWIRSWGMDCEVIEPIKLLQEIKDHVIEQAHMYQIVNIFTPAQINLTPAYYWLWAKADKKSYQVHRLIYHMIDVGQVALVLWQTVLNENLKWRIANWLKLSTDDAGRLIAFWASLHDLGKASPAFQDHTNVPKTLKLRLLRELQTAGFYFPVRGSEAHARHEVISSWSLRTTLGENLLEQLTIIATELAEHAAQMLGGHHGAFPTSDKFGPQNLRTLDKGDNTWNQARHQLVQELITIFHPPALSSFEASITEDNTMLILLAAIVSAADWLGSDDQNFPLEPEVIPLPVYVRHARHHAQLALLRAEWRPAPPMPLLDFKKTFGFDRSPAQNEIYHGLKNVILPALIIIEAPMGSGKTEAALDALAHWMHSANLNGCYIAMPTTATSNQMHGRVTKFLQALLGVNVEPLLVHSQALLQRPTTLDNNTENTIEQAEETEDGAVEEEAHSGDTAAGQSWFLPRKKSLLAPFGVGTVDQALMSVLQTKHFFVRLLGLSNKVVIFDEVHAYDAYMSVLFERLLIWLRQIGASVVVLSATLPEKTRKNLVKAYTGATAPNEPVKYPRLTIASAHGSSQTLLLTPPQPKQLRYGWMQREPQCVVDHLRNALRGGGCAAIICNTVTRAQEIYRAIKKANEDENEAMHLCDVENTILFHARFPMAWREGIEAKVLHKFGPNLQDKSKPNPTRPPRAIVVATQVIEQSLDLDFDVMISDHAPVDLLLQRAGRLQRHKANGLDRIHPFCLWICEPEVVVDIPKFVVADKLVYDEFILLRSWLALKQRDTNQIDLPGDLATLIEQVYGDEPLAIPSEAMKQVLDKAWRSLLSDKTDMQDLAEERLVREPSYPYLLTRPNMELDEDDPKTPAAFQALTRSDRPGLSVVCLHRFEGKLYTDIRGKGGIYACGKKPTSNLIKEIARASVTIRRPNIEQLLMEPADREYQKILNKWRKIAALRYHRVAIFEDGVCRLKGTSYILRLSHEFGLEIDKED